MNDNVIPEYKSMTWRQPHRDQMLVGDECVTMSQEAFDQLLEYNSTTPTGHYDGKMWKFSYIDALTLEMVWYLRWYKKHPTIQHQFLVYARKIVIGDWRALAGIK